VDASRSWLRRFDRRGCHQVRWAVPPSMVSRTALHS
jgi:hypothetical protein